MLRDAFTQDMLDKINIVDLIREDTEINGDKARCPFPDHEDKEPSFKLYENDFFCFGCNRGGTAIDYIMHRDNLDPGEAIRFLCDKSGIAKPNWSEKEKKEFEQLHREKDVVAVILREAVEYYHSQLTPERRTYFNNRGLNDETIDKYKLGYAGGSSLAVLAPSATDGLTSRLPPDRPCGSLYDAFQDGKIGKHNDRGLLLSGLFHQFDGGVIKDLFERRYILPYWNKGRAVYVIGRLNTNDEEEIEALPKWNRMKYKKLSTYDVSKRPYVSKAVRNCFYGEDSVGDNDVGIITEGVIDCLLLLQNGYSTISPVTEEFKNADLPKLATLSKKWKTVYIANDNEVNQQGEKGAEKTAQYLFEQGIKREESTHFRPLDVRIVTIPRPETVEKVDVADFLSKHPKEDFDALIGEAKGFFRWKIDKAKDLPEEDKTEATQEIMTLLATVRDNLRLEQYYDEMKEAGLIGKKKLFQESIKAAQRKQAQQAKQERLKFLEETDPEEFLKTQVMEIRKSEYTKAFEIKQNISELIAEDMRSRGKFYQMERTYFWFNQETKWLHQLDKNDFLAAQINTRYGINCSEDEYSYLLSHLHTEAIINGDTTEVHQLSYYDDEANKLYVYGNNEQIYLLDGEKIELVDNGANGVLFLKNDLWQPFRYEPQTEKKYLLPLILSQINFDAGKDCPLDADEQRLLFLYWIYSLFFASILPAKPIMTMTGPQGSGKSTAQRMVAKMLFGSKFDVTPITDEKDFDAAITHNPVVFYDQVDSYTPWLPDRLAHTATGKMIQKREYYTTNELVTFFPKCFLSISSFDPKFKRADVVDRLLLFYAARRDKFGSEHNLFNDIEKHRNQLMSELLDDLNLIVKQLSHDKEPFAVSYRMGDWGALCWRIARINQQGDEFVQIIEKMVRGQSEFVLESDTIFLCLDKWMINSDNHSREVESSTLFHDFQLLAESEKIPFKYKDTSSFGRKLKSLVPSLEEFWEVQAEKRKNRWYYRFGLKRKLDTSGG